MTGAGPGDHGADAPAPGRATPPERPVTLRPARAGDAAALAGVDAATSTQPWTETTFRTELDHRDRAYVVACAGAGQGGSGSDGDRAGDGQGNGDGEVVGYAGLAFLAGDAHVMGIAVLPSAQGRGCGRLLLTAACRVAREADAAMTLEVRPSNGAARHLYRSLGFVEAGRRRGYYPDGEDALILWRPVADGTLDTKAATTTTATATTGAVMTAAAATDETAATIPTDEMTATAAAAATLTTDGG